MQNIVLITKTKIESNKISELLILRYPKKINIINNNVSQLFIGFYPNELIINYDESYNVNDALSMFEEEEKKIIPFENGFCLDLNFWNKKIAIYAVKTLLEIYPELWINDDNGQLTSAIDYINNNNNL